MSCIRRLLLPYRSSLLPCIFRETTFERYISFLELTRNVTNLSFCHLYLPSQQKGRQSGFRSIAETEMQSLELFP